MYIIIAVVIAVLVYLFVILHKLKTTQTEAKKAWEPVALALRHRFEILPGVVDVVQRYASEDYAVLQNAINSRNIYMTLTTPAELMDIEGKLSRSIKNIVNLTEKYPSLNEDRNFVAYLKEINKTEEKISMTRQNYNQLLKKYNDLVNKAPSCYIAKIFKYAPQKFFELTPEERENIDFLL